MSEPIGRAIPVVLSQWFSFFVGAKNNTVSEC